MDLDGFLKILLSECKLDPSLPLIAGVSGGPDSLCMLDLLIRSGCRPIVVHVNHQLREEAGVEAALVQTFCDLKKLNCYVVKGDVKETARRERLSLEEAARSFRYQTLFQQAEKLQCQAVLVAHNADDQVETVLMHLLRGSGARGLRGMSSRVLPHQWSDKIPLVRPLLSVSRDEILAYCEEQHLTPSYDSSNQDTRFFRNRIRAELIPLLRSYNPEIKQRVRNLSEVIKGEDDYLSMQTQLAWSECLIREEASFLRFDLEKLRQLHPAICKRILWLGVHQIAPRLRDVDFCALERAHEFLLKKGGRNHLLLLADVGITKSFHREVLVSRGEAHLDNLWPQLSQQNLGRSVVPGDNPVGGNWLLTCRKVERMKQNTTDAFTCYLDGGLAEGARLDSFKPGDTFTPFGLSGKTVKLGDFWTNLGLPEPARKMWPLLRGVDARVLWVMGMQISYHARVRPESTAILEYSLTSPAAQT